MYLSQFRADYAWLLCSSKSLRSRFCEFDGLSPAQDGINLSSSLMLAKYKEPSIPQKNVVK